MNPLLIIFSGLPRTGKTSIAKRLAQKYGATYFRLDTIEQTLRDVCSYNVQGEGYRITHRIVEDNLKLRNHVVVDCCNPWKLTRNEWEDVGKKCNSVSINIEVVCSDEEEHKKRVEKRSNAIAGLILPTWEEVLNREYDPWDKPHIRVDSAKKSIEDCVCVIYNEIESEKESSYAN